MLQFKRSVVYTNNNLSQVITTNRQDNKMLALSNSGWVLNCISF